MAVKIVNSLFLVAVGVAISRPEFLIYLFIALGVAIFLTHKQEVKETKPVPETESEPVIKAYSQGMLKRIQNLKQYKS